MAVARIRGHAPEKRKCHIADEGQNLEGWANVGTSVRSGRQAEAAQKAAILGDGARAAPERRVYRRLRCCEVVTSREAIGLSLDRLQRKTSALRQ